MVTANVLYEEELEYSVSFRQVRRVECGGTPPPGRFETTSRARLARASRYRRGSGPAKIEVVARGEGCSIARTLQGLSR